MANQSERVTPDRDARIDLLPSLERFERDGFFVLPSFLGREFVTRLSREVDRWVDEGHRQASIDCALAGFEAGVPELVEVDLPAHGELVVESRLLAIIRRLVGTEFSFHHIHSDRHDPGVPDKSWHHDYEQQPQRDRKFLMLHAMHYLHGLDARTSSLVILPGSHHQVMEKSALSHLGTASISGEIVIDQLPLGSTVIMHSALAHARRATRGVRRARPRYFIDVSYCEVGTLWPSAKHYWRNILARARGHGLDSGVSDLLFSETNFTD